MNSSCGALSFHFVLILDRQKDVKPGDVIEKKNLWKEITDSSNRRSKVLTFPGLHLSNRFCMFPSLKLLLLNDHGKYQRMEEDVTQSGEFLYTKLCFSVSLSSLLFLNEGFNKLTQEVNENIQFYSFYSLVVYNFGKSQFLYNTGFLLSLFTCSLKVFEPLAATQTSPFVPVNH